MCNYKEIEDVLNFDLAQIEYIDNIPWAFSNPKEKFIEWSNKTQTFFMLEEHNLTHLQGILNDNLVSGPQKVRVQEFIKNKHAHLKQMKKVLATFLKENKKSIVLDNQNILSYQNNIFRDWCWGQKENEIYLNYILKNLKAEQKNILVLGAGSCGLSHMLAQNTTSNIVAVDINPYLFLVANKIMSKKHLKLYEFFDYPKHNGQSYKKWEIKDSGEEVNNHFQVFSEFESMPFKPQSFDVIIGCWFFDIIDTGLDQALLHSNHYLKSDGQLLLIGPSNFHKSKYVDKLTTDEIVTSFQENYKEVSFEVETIKYLDNPNNSYQRLEDVLFLTANTPKDSNLFKKSADLDLIRPTKELMAHKQKTEVFHKILKHIDRPITMNALAKSVQKEFGFSEEEALFYTNSVMSKLLSEINQ